MGVSGKEIVIMLIVAIVIIAILYGVVKLATRGGDS
jgi:hypothetical protein